MKKDRRSTMLECWRPPTGVGEPIGCMATTFTFDSGFFEEECLSRFLNIDSHPDRDSLAYLLERENMLGATYAGVLIDHQQAGVDHSLRWDILPVRLPDNKYQHAKISVLAWAECIRVVVASANLTPAGFRNNQEVVGTLDFIPEAMDHDQLAACCLFLNNLIEWVPTAGDTDVVHQRAKGFLNHLQQHTAMWKPVASRKSRVQTFFIFNLPKSEASSKGTNAALNGGRALDGCLDMCIRFGGAPSSVKVASPFFNQYEKNKVPDEVTAALCKRMARGNQRTLTFCLPSLNSNDENEIPRLAAPRALKDTALRYVQRLLIETLPHTDPDNNFRPWHSKMLWLENTRYVALMIGSSNFTSPAMGLRASNNTEANLLYITPQKAYAKEKGQLAECWPQTTCIEDLNAIEWTGTHYDLGETEIDQSPPLPQGFLASRFQAGKSPEIILYFIPDKLPEHWQVRAGRNFTSQVLDSDEYHRQHRPNLIHIPWKGETPGKLLVQWQDKQTFWPVNVENEHDLPMAREIDSISVHDLIHILAAHDYSMAIRAWARRQTSNLEDENLEDAVPAELDPLKRFRLQETFLHRIRTRARMLAGVRHNLQRPAWTGKALQWRLEGIIGIKFLADKLMAFKENGSEKTIEAVLELIDFFIMLDEVTYQETPGAIDQTQFDAVYRPFVHNLLESANAKTKQIQNQLPPDIRMFWERIYQRCRQ